MSTLAQGSQRINTGGPGLAFKHTLTQRSCSSGPGLTEQIQGSTSEEHMSEN